MQFWKVFCFLYLPVHSSRKNNHGSRRDVLYELSDCQTCFSNKKACFYELKKQI